MEAILALGLGIFGSLVWLGIFVTAFIIVCFVAESVENGVVAFIAALVLFGTLYFWGTAATVALSTYVTWKLVATYFGIGLVFSFVRTYFYSRSKATNFKKTLSQRISANLSNKQIAELKAIEDKKERTAAEENMKELRLEQMKLELRKDKIDELKERVKEHVFRWWFMWPISAIHWTFSHLIRDFYNWIYSGLKTIYNGLIDSAFNSIVK